MAIKFTILFYIFYLTFLKFIFLKIGQGGGSRHGRLLPTANPLISIDTAVLLTPSNNPTFWLSVMLLSTMLNFSFARVNTQFYLALSPTCAIIATVLCKAGCSGHGATGFVTLRK